MPEEKDLNSVQDSWHDLSAQAALDALQAESTGLSAAERVNPRLAVGGELRAYDNRGSFRLSRDDLRVFLDAAVGSDYLLQVAYRDVDYSEDAYDAYDAGILELALRLNW